MLQGKKIIVAVTGGIAAYKAPMIVRLLKKAGAEVKCVATQHALQFVTELTLETVSQNKVYKDLFGVENDHTTEHISMKDWGDAMVVAPATANIIGKLANGICDDALSTLLVAFRKPLFMAPAMNSEMWSSPSVQRNIERLRHDGCRFIEPAEGELACGTNGKGRMEEPEAIVKALADFFASQGLLKGKHVLVTAGPTYEKIDAVRFVGNFSTGKMGYAVATALAHEGARVTLVSGPTHLSISHPSIERIDVMSAQEMYDAATSVYPQCDAAILSAAVADFRPVNAADIKIKKQNDHDGMTLVMEQTPDILAYLGENKRDGQYLVGFALETNNEIEHARRKLTRKNLDFIVLNSLQDSGAGFGYDTNKVTFLFADGRIEEGALKSKAAVAEDIVDRLARMILEHN